MKHDISKLCADSLRTFTNDKYHIKLRAAHAHELVAAYLGYSSKNALLAETKYPIANLAQAKIIVMTPDDFIDQRRKKLQGLSSELPGSYTLGEAVYVPLFSDEWWKSEYPPFRSFEKAAVFLVENNDAYNAVFKLFADIPIHHFIDVKSAGSYVLLTVTHAHQSSTGEMIGGGQSTINLPRVAGRIGFGEPEISVEKWTGGARKKLGSLEMQS